MGRVQINRSGLIEVNKLIESRNLKEVERISAISPSVFLKVLQTYLYK